MGRSLCVTLSLFAWIILVGCNSQTNLLGATVPPEHKDTFENLVTMARAAYNDHDLKKAHRLALRAYSMNQQSEDVAVLYGFINLSLAGADPFSLATTMASNATKKPAEESSGEAPKQSTNDALAPLKALVKLSAEEQAAIATLDDTDPELPVLLPRCAEEARELVPRLAYLQEAILVVCPFVDAEARIAGDYRQRCEPYTGRREDAGKAHFLWALAHLSEALSFHDVLTHGAGGSEGNKSNLELRVEKLAAQNLDDPTELGRFLGAVQSLEASVNAIMPLSGRCSDLHATTQFYATLNDLLAVDAAFSRMSSLPSSISDAITGAMGRIKAGGGGVGSSLRAAQARALRRDMTDKMTQSLSAKVEQILSSRSSDGTGEAIVDAAQKASLCAAVTSISGGEASAPASCRD